MTLYGLLGRAFVDLIDEAIESYTVPNELGLQIIMRCISCTPSAIEKQPEVWNRLFSARLLQEIPVLYARRHGDGGNLIRKKALISRQVKRNKMLHFI